jgi:large subunit ribosomal protein L17
MRHRKQKTSLGRLSAERKALMRSLSESLILHGRIKTTVAKAKALRTFVEPLITEAKRGTLASRRNVMKVLYTDKAVNQLMDVIAPKYKERAGGYTRITKIGQRPKDAAHVAIMELV